MIVVDASALLEVLLRTPAGKAVERRLFEPRQTLHAPHLLDVEVAQVIRRYAANGVITNQSFDAATGRMLTVQAGPSGSGTSVADFTYVFDKLGDLTSRSDGNANSGAGLTESFTYDVLDRVIGASIAGGSSKTFAYDATGNIASKPEAGTYTYPAAGVARPHAVTSITGGTLMAATSFTMMPTAT